MKIYMQTEFSDDFIFNGDIISKTSYSKYLPEPNGIINAIKFGTRGRSLFAKLRNPEFIHNLYHNKDKDYMNFLNNFKRKYHDYDVIVMNPGIDLVHPEYLYKEFPNALKVLYMIDDPHTTYSYSLPFAWAFDAAVHVIQGYPDYSLSEILKNVGINNVKWVPHCVTNIQEPKWTLEELRAQLSIRNNKAIYVGQYYAGKQRRLSYLKYRLKNDLDIFGRYPLQGWSFPLLTLRDGFVCKYRVRGLSNSIRDQIYEQYAVGINMHLTGPFGEVGNTRMYELAYRGVAQVVEDTPDLSNIFTPEREVLTYKSMEECVDQVNRLFQNPELRMMLALNAYERACAEYRYGNVVENLINWFKLIRSSNKLGEKLF